MHLSKISSKQQFIIFATIIGNFLEWFDFSLFGMMLPFFAKLFFPNQPNSLIYFFILFAVGGIARPIGGLFFGYIGDKWGRKTALVRTLVFMTVSILLIAVLPSFKQIGTAATLLLGIFYLFQGFCMGGEFPGSVVFLVESAPQKSRGFMGSWAYFGVFLGMSFALLDVFSVNQLLPEADFENWGWRLPFFAGALLGIIGIFLRRLLHETSVFEEAKHYGYLLKEPVQNAFKKHKRQLLIGMGIFTMDAIGFNLLFVFSSSYFSSYLAYPFVDSFMVTGFSIAIALVCVPIMGKISDRVGTIRLAKGALYALLLLVVPLNYLMLQNSLLAVFIAQGTLAVLLSMYLANLPALLNILFPTQVRYSCSAIVINFSVALFGGTTPLLIGYLIQRTGSFMIPSYYLLFGVLISLWSLSKVKGVVKLATH